MQNIRKDLTSRNVVNRRGAILDEQTIAEGLALQRELGVRWTKEEWTDWRINRSSNEEEKQRKLAQTSERVRMSNDKETKIAERISAASEGDNLAKRLTGQQIEERIRQEEERQQELIKENKQLKDLREQGDYYQ